MPTNNELKMPVFHIDDQPVEFQPGEKILSAALRNGKKIPLANARALSIRASKSLWRMKSQHRIHISQ